MLSRSAVRLRARPDAMSTKEAAGQPGGEHRTRMFGLHGNPEPNGPRSRFFGRSAQFCNLIDRSEIGA